MREKIIEESIQSLHREGLRFSVDTLAERLHVSKKTIYKYFPTKEALALAMYERYYEKLQEAVETILREPEDSGDRLLLCYFDSAIMIRGEIFNKYALNRAVGSFARKKHGEIWQKIRPRLCFAMEEEEAQAYGLIVDGAFDRAIGQGMDPHRIITMLRKMEEPKG